MASTKKQQEIPGAERETIEEIDEVCVELVRSIEHLKKLKGEVDDLKAAALHRMDSHKLDVYRFRDGGHCHVLRRSLSESLKVQIEVEG